MKKKNLDNDLEISLNNTKAQKVSITQNFASRAKIEINDTDIENELVIDGNTLEDTTSHNHLIFQKFSPQFFYRIGALWNRNSIIISNSQIEHFTLTPEKISLSERELTDCKEVLREKFYQHQLFEQEYDLTAYDKLQSYYTSSPTFSQKHFSTFNSWKNAQSRRKFVKSQNISCISFPLTIIGGQGVGKTSLSHNIALEQLATNPDAVAIYINYNYFISNQDKSPEKTLLHWIQKKYHSKINNLKRLMQLIDKWDFIIIIDDFHLDSTSGNLHFVKSLKILTNTFSAACFCIVMNSNCKSAIKELKLENMDFFQSMNYVYINFLHREKAIKAIKSLFPQAVEKINIKASIQANPLCFRRLIDWEMLARLQNCKDDIAFFKETWMNIDQASLEYLKYICSNRTNEENIKYFLRICAEVVSERTENFICLEDIFPTDFIGKSIYATVMTTLLAFPLIIILSFILKGSILILLSLGTSFVYWIVAYNKGFIPYRKGSFPDNQEYTKKPSLFISPPQIIVATTIYILSNSLIHGILIFIITMCIQKIYANHSHEEISKSSRPHKISFRPYNILRTIHRNKYTILTLVICFFTGIHMVHQGASLIKNYVYLFASLIYILLTHIAGEPLYHKFIIKNFFFHKIKRISLKNLLQDCISLGVLKKFGDTFRFQNNWFQKAAQHHDFSHE